MQTDDLATLDEVKQYFDYSGSVAEDDDFINDLITRVSKSFCHYCGKDSFLINNYTEYIDGNGSQYMFVKNTPIVSVDAIYKDIEWVWAEDTLVESTNYFIKDYYIANKYCWYEGFSNYKVIYNGGYAEVPYDLKEAAIQEIVRKYKRRKDFDTVQRSVNEGYVTYVDDFLLESTIRVLSRYRRKNGGMI
jgi:hypothetical protein